MADMNGNKVYAVDFDGTLSVGEEWPGIGQPNEQLFNFLIEQKAAGARIILWTCRNGEDLAEATRFCKSNGLEFDTVNKNLPEFIELYGGDTRKINADYYIDDKAINPIPEKAAEGILLGRFSNKLEKEFKRRYGHEYTF
jgi:hypothetical protein